MVKYDVKELEGIINKNLRDGYKIIVGHRYDYLGIDLYNNDEMVKTLITGLSRKEAYQWLDGFLTGFSFKEDYYKKDNK